MVLEDVLGCFWQRRLVANLLVASLVAPFFWRRHWGMSSSENELCVGAVVGGDNSPEKRGGGQDDRAGASRKSRRRPRSRSPEFPAQAAADSGSSKRRRIGWKESPNPSPVRFPARLASRRRSTARSRSRSPRRVVERPRERRAASSHDREFSMRPKVKICTLCGDPILPHERCYRDTTNLHNGCGLAMRASQRSKKLDGVRDQFADIQRQVPKQARDALMSLMVEPGQTRRFDKFIGVVTTWKRSHEITNGRKTKEMDELEFIAHWVGRGRSDAQAKKRWAKATSAKALRKKQAFYVGKKIHVWVKKRRCINEFDRLAQETSFAEDGVKASKQQAFSMIGKQIAFDEPAKKALGGIHYSVIIIFIIIIVV